MCFLSLAKSQERFWPSEDSVGILDDQIDMHAELPRLLRFLVENPSLNVWHVTVHSAAL